MELLSAEGDPYDGVLVDAGALPVDREQFSERLQQSLEVLDFTCKNPLLCCSMSRPAQMLGSIWIGLRVCQVVDA